MGSMKHVRSYLLIRKAMKVFSNHFSVEEIIGAEKEIPEREG